MNFGATPDFKNKFNNIKGFRGGKQGINAKSQRMRNARKVERLASLAKKFASVAVKLQLWKEVLKNREKRIEKKE